LLLALQRINRMTTAIISALPDEQAGLALLLTETEEITHAGRPLKKGLLHGKPVILALAGIGKVAAATTATLLIERFAVQRILFTGVAGAVATHVQVGDVVIGKEYLQHDMDASPLFPRHELPLYGKSRLLADTAMCTMLSIALRAYSAGADSQKDLKKANIHEGLILSGDRFVSSKEEVMKLRAELPDALCVEMEGAAIAQVCHDYQLPYCAVRTISDRADDDAHVDFPRFIAQVAGPMAVRIVSAFMQSSNTL
jgi:adenosylhomocysteine nucleosidase